MYDSYKFLSVRREDGVVRIVMDNPPMNGMSAGIHTELSTIFSLVNHDSDARVIILTGAGERAFCAGGDPSKMSTSVDDHGRWATSMREARALVLGMLSCDLPIVGRINGHAIGVGATIALCCDVTVMVETAKIGDTHIKVGLSAGDGGSLLWPHLVGLMTAKRYLLTGDLLTGREAANTGLVTEAASQDDFDRRVDSWINRFASGPTQALRFTKRSLNMTLRQQAEAFMDAHLGLETLAHQTADHREAIKAIVESRAAIFTGK